MTTQWRQATQFFRKIYLSLYWKGCVWEGVGDRTELQHIDTHLLAITVLLGCSTGGPGAWGPSLCGCWFSLSHLISNSSDPQLTDFCLHPGYIIIWCPLIQSVHGQGYNILIFLDRMHLLFTQVHFLFWQPGWVGGQYTTDERNLVDMYHWNTIQGMSCLT